MGLIIKSILSVSSVFVPLNSYAPTSHAIPSGLVAPEKSVVKMLASDTPASIVPLLASVGAKLFPITYP